MSQRLISRSPDLKQLRDEGYDLEIRSGYLLAKDVPYVNATKEVKRGTLVFKLTLAGDVTAAPDDHVAHFAGEHPCREDGKEIAQIKNQSSKRTLAEGVVVDHTFSAKPQPTGKYEDYYAKVTTYDAILSTPARLINPNVTAKTFPVIVPDAGGEGVFNYIDTASSRAEIDVIAKKLALGKVAIIGLGGTGAYVLDLVAKTPVQEIHLFDGDRFLQHNAFRAPGAASIDELHMKSHKVVYLRDLYSKMRRGIVAHEEYISEHNIEQLHGMDFVFCCLDRGSSKRLLVAKLEEWGMPFVDVGMGVYVSEDCLGGILRTTTSTREKRDHLGARVPFTDGDGSNEYALNIQIADLNALNAALAVIKWKKLFGFYLDIDREHHSTYTIDGNTLTNEDRQP
jgi:hypothetical protein